MVENRPYMAGLWHVNVIKDGHGTYLRIDTEQLETGGSFIVGFGSTDGNVQLMATAPELVDALESMILSFELDEEDMYPDERNACKKAHAAIAKAKGEV